VLKLLRVNIIAPLQLSSLPFEKNNRRWQSNYKTTSSPDQFAYKFESACHMHVVASVHARFRDYAGLT